jgi:hypothetical protein
MRHEKYNRSEYNEAMKRKRRNYSVNGHDKMDINGHGNSPQSDG